MSSSSPSLQNSAVMKPFACWFDREARFDLPPADFEVQTARGELLLATMQPVDDSKGNTGDDGIFFVTNLRCLWRSCHNKRRNLSIGYHGIQNMEVRRVASRLRGPRETLRISARFNSSRFEFLFAYLLHDSRTFTTATSVWRAYDSSRLYRDLKLRSSVIRDGELLLLQDEKLFSRHRGVSNVSNDQGHIGTFFTTNIRLVWCSQLTTSFNVSIPYMQVTGLHMRQTRFGQAFIIETSVLAGSYVLGFRVDPKELLVELFKESTALWKAWTAHPILGIAVMLQDTLCEGDNTRADTGASTGVATASTNGTLSSSSSRHIPPPSSVPDGANVVEEVPTDAFAAYYADVGQKGVDRRPEYDVSIGLAVEKLRTGVTLQDLWTVVT